MEKSKRTVGITIRVTPEEKAMIEKLAKESCRSITAQLVYLTYQEAKKGEKK